MQPSFSITVDVSLSLVRVTLAGFFLPADVKRFHKARREAHQLLTCRPHEHQTIVDMREMKIQPQETVIAFQAILADPSYHGRQIELLFPPPLPDHR